MVRPNFTRAFIQDIDWSTHKVGAILSHKERKNEKVITYICKGLSVVKKKFHPMEGECYALMWGIIHFKQYSYCNHCTFQIDHKLLKWLAMVFDAYRRRGMWINTLQDFSFKIIHRVRSKHTNVDALSRNLMDVVGLDENLVNEIQDYKMLQYIRKSRETLLTSMKSSKMGLLLQLLGS